MPSMIFYYENETIRTKKLDGLFRSLAWDASEKGLILVGNSGRVVTLIGEEVRYLNSGTRQNLRAVSVNPVDAQIMIVGNAGTILRINKQGQVAKIESPATENLRAVSWDRTGTVALIAGNRGTLLRYSNERCNPVENARANLRRVSWRPGFDEALITSNCFAEEFFPSPNLHNYNLTTNMSVHSMKGAQTSSASTGILRAALH